VGRPKKLSDRKREAVVRDYVALCDIAESDYIQREGRYRDDFVRFIARRHRTSRRMVDRCLGEANLRHIYLDNKKFLRTPQAQKILKYLKEMKDNKK
jgi:hypothetical protein